ncbi:MAG: hypothetical protein J1F28_03385, partial [Oscillospiraceae bacterium]|nr:hypothetical protein [Oscillospiraceae bacterium]
MITTLFINYQPASTPRGKPWGVDVYIDKTAFLRYNGYWEKSEFILFTEGKLSVESFPSDSLSK